MKASVGKERPQGKEEELEHNSDDDEIGDAKVRGTHIYVYTGARVNTHKRSNTLTRTHIHLAQAVRLARRLISYLFIF